MAHRTVALRGDRCRCPSCGQLFNSTRSFDEHRTGDYAVARRCLSTVEMLARGMRQNASGFWLTRASARPYPVAARRGGDRHQPATATLPARL
jgi:hypothetical protein